MKRLLYLLVILNTTLFAQYNQTIYFDPTNSGDPNQDGSIEHPYDHVTDIDISQGTDYRFKRGTQMTLSNRIYLNYTDNIRLRDYGSGEKPILYMSDVSEDIITIQSNHNVIIENLHLINNNTLHSGVRGIEMAPGYGGNPNTQNITISNLEIEGGWVGINVQHGNGDYYTENLTIRNCEIHHVGMDGILFRDVTNGLVEGCNIHNINQYWHTTTHGQSAGGDGIQTAHNCDNLKIYNNIIDRRSTGNKFCILIGNLDDTTEPCYTEIVGNTFYPPKDTTDSNGGVAVYLQEAGGAPATILFARNKIIGRKDHLGNSCQSAFRGDCDTLYFYYNIIDSCNFNSGVQRITSDCDYAEVFNNVFMGGDIASTNVFGIDAITAVVKNNLSAGNNGGHPLRTAYVDNLEESNNIEISSSNSSLFNDYLSIANWETSDFTRTANLNDGAPLNLGYDFDSIPVGNPPDCGAYEYYDGNQSNTPPNINNQLFNVEENAANGTQVGVVLATDPDPDQFLTYTILSGNTSNAFQIDGLSGVLTVNNNDVLDFEITPSFNLTIRVQDNGEGGLSDQAIINVNLIDGNEAPEIFNQDFIIEANSQNGDEVGVMYTIDPDFNQSLSYSIISGNLDEVFYLDPYSGVLFIANSAALNYLSNPYYNLTVKVEDNGTGNLSDQASINIYLTIGNVSPKIMDQDFVVSENTPNGSAIGLMHAVDPDFGQTLTYTILSGNTNNAFHLDPYSGILTVSNSSMLNYEVNTEFNLVVQVQDNGPGYLVDQDIVKVEVSNINEPPFIYYQDFIISEDAPNGAMIGLMHAEDSDLDQSLSYSIILGNENGEFFLDPNSGILFVANSQLLNCNISPVYDLVVQVMDDGPGNLIDMEVITILLIEGNGSDNDLISEITKGNIFKELSIYPNPTKQSINIDLPNIGNDYFKIKIFNLYGKMVKEVELNAMSGNTNIIDIGELQEGTYILQVGYKNSYSRKKIVKL